MFSYTLYVYNDESRRLERYLLKPYQALPYTCCHSSSASDFFSNTVSTLGWTSSSFLKHWSDLRRKHAVSGIVFRRIFEGGFISQSMHYTGTAICIPNAPQDIFPFQESNRLSLLPAGYPETFLGDIGLFVLVLQDSLCALGYCEGELDGFFGSKTETALQRFCKDRRITYPGSCTKELWNSLANQAAGRGCNSNIKYINKNKIIL